MEITNLVILAFDLLLVVGWTPQQKRLENVFHFQVTMLDGWPQLVLGGKETRHLEIPPLGSPAFAHANASPGLKETVWGQRQHRRQQMVNKYIHDM